MRYQEVSHKFWSDSVVRRWPTEIKLIGIYLLTSRHTQREGLFHLPMSYVAADLGYPIEGVSKGYLRMEEDGFLEFDAESEVVFVCKALKYRAPKGAKQVAGAMRSLGDLPATRLLAGFLRAAGEWAPELAEAMTALSGYPFDTPSMGYPLARALTSNSNSNSNSTSTSNSNSSVVSPPNGGSSNSADAEPDPPPPEVREVFAVWIECTGRTGRTQLSAKRQRLIRRALAGYPVADVLDAVRGWQQSAFHRGENSDGRRYDHLELLLRDAEHIEHFRDLERGVVVERPAQSGGRPSKADRISQRINDMGQLADELERAGR